MDVAALEQDSGKQLAWEARHRMRAAVAAFLGAAGLIAFYILQQVLQKDAPLSSGLEALQRAGSPHGIAGLPSLRASFFEYMNTKAALVVVIGIGGLIGYCGLAWAAGFLGVATRNRLPAFKRFMIYLPIIGGVLLGVAVLVLQIAKLQVVNDFLDGPR